MLYNVYTIRKNENGITLSLRRKELTKETAQAYYKHYQANSEVRYIMVRLDKVQEFIAKVAQEHNKIVEKYADKMARQEKRWAQSAEMYKQGYRANDVLGYVHG